MFKLTTKMPDKLLLMFLSKRFLSTPVLQVLSLDARGTLIKLKENSGVVYSRFSKYEGLDIEPSNVEQHFIKIYKKLCKIEPCFGAKTIGARDWWKKLVIETLNQSYGGSYPKSEKIAEQLFDYYSTKDAWELIEPNIRQTLQKFRLKGINLVVTSNFDSRLKIMDMFRKPKKRMVASRQREETNSGDEVDAVVDVKGIRKRKRLNPMVQSTKKQDDSKRDSSSDGGSSDSDVAVAEHSYAASGEAGPSGPRDQGATATLDIDTDRSIDAQAQFERVQQQLKEGVEKDGKILYKGAALYGAKEAKDTVKGNASSGLNRIGPVRAPQFLRQTVRWDFAPDICKDYKETGYCTFGDSCKFVHDRSDYKHGWEIDQEFEEGRYGQEDETNYEIHEDEDAFPEECYVCGNEFVDPIVTKCKHYFCSECALKTFRTTSKCPICNQNTEKIMNAARDLIAHLKKKKTQVKEETSSSDDENKTDEKEMEPTKSNSPVEGNDSVEHEDDNLKDVEETAEDPETDIVMEDLDGLDGGEDGGSGSDSN
ncbi:unnamed protein product [Caenorhabditis bovis]|uniref:RING-type E3 ubiquitin transferase n=1 Tax=Caenorhabditis bovis TaxID=2654633 RepID=A0A8S1EQK3_9PELO|nr:unnamed protein product [Caenorhabditis bovis]